MNKKKDNKDNKEIKDNNIKICFFYVDTTGLHKTNETVTKKNLFEFARLVTINYYIGTYNNINNEFEEEINIRKIIKPRCMIIPDETVQYHNITNDIALNEGEDIELILNKFKNDIKDVDVLVSHNVDFHLKTIISELVRYNIILNFCDYNIIDTISFNHQYHYPKLMDLAKNLKVKRTNKSQIEIITDVFFKLLKT